MIGQTVGNYRIVEKLGEGGMGTVYKGVDVMLEREVAIKMLRPEIARQQDVVERFRTEAVTLAKLNHPSIATLFNFFREGDQFFMVMEYVPGRTLERVIQEAGALPVDRAVAVMWKVLDGIEHAHELGVLHRDLKPANIMLMDSGGVKVMDFGIARILGAARMTRSGRIVGTLEYIAPERVRGQEADVRSDLYSMGIVLYEMLAGRLPFTSDSEYELMRAQIEAAPPPMETLGAHVPPAIDAAVMRALAKNPEERFASATEFRAALGGVPLPAAASNAPAVKPTRLAAPMVKETRLAAHPGSGGLPSAPATAPALAGKLGRKHAVAGGAVLTVAAAAAIFWIAHKPAPKITLAPPPSSAPVGQAAAKPPASEAGAPLQGLTMEQPKQSVEDLVKSADTLPGAVVEPVKQPARQTPLTPVSKPPADLRSAPREAAIPSGPPLSLAEILTLLHAGTSSARVVQIVEARGTGFVSTPQIASQIGSAGGDRALVAAVSKHSAAPSQVAAAPTPAPPVQPPPVQPSAPVQVVGAAPGNPPGPASPTAPAGPSTVSSGGAQVATLSQVRRLFIEPMANDLHLHISAEILRQLGGRIQLANSKDQADAIMTGTAELRGGAAGTITGKVLGVTKDQTANVMITDVAGKNVLWADEAGSRKILMGVIKKGGPRKIAEHLVSSLKKALR